MDILTVALQIGTQYRGFSAQFPAKKGPRNLTPNARQKYEQRFGRETVECLVLKHLGPYFVHIFVHIFALFVGGGGGEGASVTRMFQTNGFNKLVASTTVLHLRSSLCKSMFAVLLHA